MSTLSTCFPIEKYQNFLIEKKKCILIEAVTIQLRD